MSTVIATMSISLDGIGSGRNQTEERPFGDVVAWANLELMKSAAEIGYARFLYAVQTG